MEVYCGKCKSKTPTSNASLKVYEISRTLKSNVESKTPRNVIKGFCLLCGTKKHILAGKEVNIIENVKLKVEPNLEEETKVEVEELPKRKKRVRYSKDLNKISEELLKESENL
jgi:protein associated with RNAse G/E